MIASLASCPLRRPNWCNPSLGLTCYYLYRCFLQRFSEDKYHFNHTRIHRGYCLTKRCSHIQATSLSRRYEKCVDNYTRAQYALETNLTSLDYCKTSAKSRTRRLDGLDLIFTCVVAAIIMCNIIGTAYDVLRNHQNKRMYSCALRW